MKVKDLIRILEQQNQEAEIIIDYTYESGEIGWSSTEQEERDAEMVYPLFDEVHISAYDQSNLEEYGGIKIFK